MCFRHSHRTSGPGRMVAHEHLILLFGNRQYFTQLRVLLVL
jgi:hypothetical protein